MINSLLLFSCSIKKVEVIVVGCTPSLIEIYNGKRLLLKDSLKNSNMDGVSKALITRYNFSDSLFVKVISFKGPLRINKIKIKRNKYIYIEQDGLNLKVFGTNKRKMPI